MGPTSVERRSETSNLAVRHGVVLEQLFVKRFGSIFGQSGISNRIELEARPKIADASISNINRNQRRQ
jgi:hypothetical protein